ncbi:MAG: HD domain-containing protein [Desulfobacterales bacterium]|nr:HD domain-containing protein [Desulfobacterales bacterium]
MKDALVRKAAEFAAQKHKGQIRKGRNECPYIEHLKSVASVIAEVGGIDDPHILAAAWLHDTLEDTETSPEELEAAFGKRVRRLVEEVSDDKSLPKDERKQLQIRHAPELSPDAVLIKLGDKISNIIDVTHTPPPQWTLERRLTYLNWAATVINKCPKVNSALEHYFAEVLGEGRRALRAD